MKNKTKRRLLPLVFVLLLQLMLPLSVHADVIYEPMNSKFYERHRTECRLVDAVYEVRHPNGSAKLYVSPEDAAVVAEFKNGENLHVSVSYTDKKGVVWACCNSSYGREAEDAWMPMDYLYEAYSSELFRRDYSEKITVLDEPEEISVDGDPFKGFLYPGSEKYVEISQYYEGEEAAPVWFNMRYTDEAGHEWACMSYYFGYRDYWVALDAPEKTAEELYPAGLPKIDPRENGGTLLGGAQNEIKPSMNKKAVAIAGIGVLAVVAAASALLMVLKKSKK